jgi:uncharacterized protein (DUF111 family)
MFVAALLDAWPELETEVRRALESVQLPPSVSARALPHKDHTLQGTRFCVEDANAGHGHAHTAFREIRERLCDSALTPPVRERAIDIFTLLAAAEGRVHGLPPEQVRFHEVGAWDSIADIVAAAQLIETSGATAWSLSSLPLGSGRVQTVYGSLPVPAPATALLLEGLPVHDDGLEGERVTPTGAAILRHLSPAYRAPAEPMRITRTGIGFGTKRFPPSGSSACASSMACSMCCSPPRTARRGDSAFRCSCSRAAMRSTARFAVASSRQRRSACVSRPSGGPCSSAAPRPGSVARGASGSSPPGVRRAP